MDASPGLSSLISRFFSGEGYEPHGMCYLWTPGLIALHVISDSLIALSYFSIPFLLVYFVRRRRDIPFSWIFVMFSLFIVACGITHGISVYEVWHGAYWLSGIAKAATAAISIATAAMMVPLLPQALALRTPGELELLNNQLSASLAEKEEILDRLERQHRIGLTIRAHYLPPLPEDRGGIAFDAAYVPAESESRLGGDWYAAFMLPDGRYLISIGDVVGHGLEAAIAMDRIRTAISMAAINAPSLSEVLERVNTFVRIRGIPYATALIAMLDPRSLRLEYAGAGHPPMSLVEPDERIERLWSRGPMLGAVANPCFASAYRQLTAGSRLVLFTDGLVEYGRNIVSGEARLGESLAGASRSRHPASAIYSRVVGDVSPSDDVAVLVVTIDGPARGG